MDIALQAGPTDIGRLGGGDFEFDRQRRRDVECPFSGITSWGRVWRKDVLFHVTVRECPFSGITNYDRVFVGFGLNFNVSVRTEG